MHTEMTILPGRTPTGSPAHATTIAAERSGLVARTSFGLAIPA